MKDSFIFYRSFYECLKGLPDDSRLRLYDNICEMALNENDIDGLKGFEVNIFTLIRPQILANNQRYENGKKGGRPKKKTKGSNNKKTIGYENEKPNVNENVNENENENNNVNENKNIKEKYFDDETVNEMFIEFLQLRKNIKAKNTDRAINTLVNKLNKYDDDTKYKMLEKSIVNSWKDVYEIKDTKSEREKRIEEWLNSE